MVLSCGGYFLFLLCTISAAVRLPHGSVHAPKDQWRCGIPGVRPDDWLDPHLFRHVSHPHLLYLQIHHSGGAAFGGNKKICSYSDLRINFPKCIWLISRLFIHSAFLLRSGHTYTLFKIWWFEKIFGKKICLFPSQKRILPSSINW